MKSTRQNHRCLKAIAVAIAGVVVTAVNASAIENQQASVNKNTSVSALAEKPDVAPGVKRKVSPVYPYEALIEGRTGWAEATFVVDYVGRPLFANPKEASDPAFAKAVVAMIEASEYVPGKRDKHTVMTPGTEQVHFAGESTLDPAAKRILVELRRGEGSIVSMKDLDERPRAVRQDSPAYPRALKDDGITGHAEIEFVVDRDGRVLFPRIVSATHEDFGWAAATAVAQWRYQPPQKDGKKVDAKMRVPILFDAQKLASSD
jgi:TonB family protein